MSFLNKLEAQLDEWLHKKAPVQLPTDLKKSLAGALWWIALVVGLAQLWAVWILWHLGHLVATVDQAYNTYLSNVYGAAAPTTHLGLFYWLAFLASAAAAVLLLLAAPRLKQMNKGGWDLLYYAALVNAAYAVVRLLSGVDVLSGFIGAAIGSVVGAYFLFQVREFFAAKKPAHGAPAHAAHHDKD